MRRIMMGLLGITALLALLLPVMAQEGFPLKGTWIGDWGDSPTARNQVFVVFDWDGKMISGAVNPGTDTIAVKNASLTPTATGAPQPTNRGVGQGVAGGNRGGAQAGAGGAAAGATVPPLPPAGGAPAAGAGGGNRGGGGGGARGGGAAAPPTEWVVHFEGDGKDAKGNMVHYVVDGKIENIGLYNRTLSGTWVSGNSKATFRLQRQ